MRHPFLDKMFDRGLTADEEARFAAVNRELDVLEMAMSHLARERFQKIVEEMEGLKNQIEAGLLAVLCEAPDKL